MTPQPGIFALGAGEHLYLQGDLLPSVDLAAVCRTWAAHEEGDARTAGVNVVVGFRPEQWPALGATRPEDAIGFNDDVVGPDGYRMPATQHDLWLWVSGGTRSAVFDATTALRRALSGLVDVIDESEGWAYGQGRDLTGFRDGTENPSVLEAPDVVAPEGSGSIVLVQTWIHDGPGLDRLSEREQELLIGRTKADSIELEDSVMPPTSHVARTAVTDESGVELPIYRRNTALGTPSSHGTQFVGFSRDRARLQLMLDRMAGVPDGIRDALTTVASAVSGGYYYVPTLEELAEEAGS